MVNKQYTTSKYAFTMIELIFAIVVISIAVMSLPVMTRITSKSIESNIVQEAVFAASAELIGATSYYWDENSMQDIDKSYLSRVINITGDCFDQLRTGHIDQPKHRMCLDVDSNNSVRNSAGGTVDDLNDIAVTKDIFTTTNTTGAGYKKSYTSTIAVTLEADNNIKKITSTISDSGTDIVKLYTYTANIGEIDFYKRRF